ncbi:MAG: hypothetical protein ACE5FU_14905, partial [Nitrospinota bacterium]
TIRMQVSGEGMDTKTRDFNAADKTGTISGIPVGNRTVLFEGLDSADKAIYRGLPTTVVVQSDVTVEVEVEMEAL